MQFASRRSFSRRVTAFTDFERTIPPRLLWFPSSAFPLIATTPAIILTGSRAGIARHRALVGPRHWHPITREKQPRRCINFHRFWRGVEERKTHPSSTLEKNRSAKILIVIFGSRKIETILLLTLRSSHKLEVLRKYRSISLREISLRIF